MGGWRDHQHQDGRRRLPCGRDVLTHQQTAEKCSPTEAAPVTSSAPSRATSRINEDAQGCVEQVVRSVGPVDTPVNNAGITRDMTFKNGQGGLGRGNAHQSRLGSQHDQAGVRRMVTAAGAAIINVASVNGSKGASARPITPRRRPACMMSRSRSRWKWRARA